VVCRRSTTGEPTRLDVVLHGSSRTARGDERTPVYGSIRRGGEGRTQPRTTRPTTYERCTRWAALENGLPLGGGDDVFERSRQYAGITNGRDRIVLRGMSMGGLRDLAPGVKARDDPLRRPRPYCGYVDTHESRKTPQPKTS